MGYDIWTFKRLRENNISGEQLYIWSASIDTVERYNNYLNNLGQDDIFYNCTPFKFGPTCKYSFVSLTEDFSKVVTNTFDYKPYESDEITNGTCYTFLTCDMGMSALCLDWSEICDGKLDCIGGIDELDCQALEFNVCDSSEFQCQNGQCIPFDLFQDDPINPDCADGTDEPWFDSSTCNIDPALCCESRALRNRRQLRFSCGDGTLTSSLPLLRSCRRARHNRLSLSANEALSNACWRSIISFLGLHREVSLQSSNLPCTKKNATCFDYIERHCVPQFLFPASPVLFGHVYLLYTSDRQYNEKYQNYPEFVCYNITLCTFIQATHEFNGFHCRLFIELVNMGGWKPMLEALAIIFRTCSLPNNDELCENTTLKYRCNTSSKCISTRRLSDGIEDCYGGSDERTTKTCLLNDKTRIKCQSQDRCVTHFWQYEEKNDQIREQCVPTIALEFEDILYFQAMRDGFVDFNQAELQIWFRNKSNANPPDTDESYCEAWPCDNIYTRCDGFWNCPNGTDELKCSSLNICAEQNSFECVSPQSFDISCLPAVLAGNDQMDCVGGTDERFFCRNFSEYQFRRNIRYRCMNSTSCIDVDRICNNYPDCEFAEDENENLCENITEHSHLCDPFLPYDRDRIGKLLCELNEHYRSVRDIHFLLDEKQYNSVKVLLPEQKSEKQEQKSIYKLRSFNRVWECNRGILLLYNDSEALCLCPPHYYGNRCEFQAQRIDLSFRVQTIDFRTNFKFVVMLVDNTDDIHSYEQREFLAERDCNLRFDITLPYTDRPINRTKQYSIRLDAFNMLEYRASWLFQVKLLFLPVYRISTILQIPYETRFNNEMNCSKCIHGKCVKYMNQAFAFCRCTTGWIGVTCEKPASECNCASNSTCLGFSKTRSVCICPLGKFGTRCMLTRSSCHPNPCLHGATCISSDARIAEINFTCICKEGYTGMLCQGEQTLIHITFKVPIPAAFFAHLITVVADAEPVRLTTMKKIAYDQESVTIYTSEKFHIVFIEFTHVYYLAIVQSQHKPSSKMYPVIKYSDRCPSIDELLNSTVLSYVSIRRLQHYHVLCRKRTDLSCFHDKEHMCLCTKERHANCFRFNHSMIYTCQVLDYCKNNAQCFQNHETCPSTMACVCADCFYGSRCQFSTIGAHLSLDVILGYQIRPHTIFVQQSLAVKVSAAIVIILVIMGLVNSILVILTVGTAACQVVGTGLYLLISSITTLVIFLVLALKFSYLVFSQSKMIISGSLLTVSCATADTLLTVPLIFYDWLNACVSFERVMAVYQDVSFSKAASRKTAKLITFVLLSLTIITYMHDPLNRQLIHDGEEQRTWCIVTYSSTVQLYNMAINLLHFLTPFCINIVSAVVIIFKLARRRSVVQKKNTFRQHLNKQLYEHKHILVAPIVFIILAVPRLLFTFISGCLKSARNPWISLTGYFISFVPPLLTFAVYVLPSKLYKEEFAKSYRRKQLVLRRLFSF